MRWYWSEIWDPIMCLNEKGSHEQNRRVESGAGKCVCVCGERRWDVSRGPWEQSNSQAYKWTSGPRSFSIFPSFLKQESSLCLSIHGGSVILLKAILDKALHCALQIYEIISCIIKENTNMRVWQHEMSLWRTALKLSTKAPMIFNTRHMFNITARINSAMARSCPEISVSKTAVMKQRRGLERTDLYALLH